MLPLIPVSGAEPTKTSASLGSLGKDICGVLEHLPDPNHNLNVSAVVGSLEIKIGGRYHRDGVFYDPAFIQTDDCQVIEREIGIQGKGPLTSYEYVLTQELLKKKYPAGAVVLIIMQMRHNKVVIYSGFGARAMNALKALRGAA